MNYLLVENKQFVVLGPLPWRQRMFQEEINDLEINFKLPATGPEQYVKLNDEYEIYPVKELIVPSHDQVFEELAGPYWEFANLEAKGHYVAYYRQINAIQGIMKQIAANERYNKEILGTKTTIQNLEVTIDTGRDARNIFVQKYSLMQNGETVQWKFPEGWLTLSKEELSQCVSAGVTYIQNQFDWENSISQQIDSCTTIQELKNIVIVTPPNILPAIE